MLNLKGSPLLLVLSFFKLLWMTQKDGKLHIVNDHYYFYPTSTRFKRKGRATERISQEKKIKKKEEREMEREKKKKRKLNNSSTMHE